MLEHKIDDNYKIIFFGEKRERVNRRRRISEAVKSYIVARPSRIRLLKKHLAVLLMMEMCLLAKIVSCRQIDQFRFVNRKTT